MKKIIRVFSLFLFFSITGYIEIYAQDRIEDEALQGNRPQDNRKYPSDKEGNYSDYPGIEDYSPYPPSFIIPKGVCEKNEPVMTIENKRQDNNNLKPEFRGR